MGPFGPSAAAQPVAAEAAFLASDDKDWSDTDPQSLGPECPRGLASGPASWTSPLTWGPRRAGRAAPRLRLEGRSPASPGQARPQPGGRGPEPGGAGGGRAARPRVGPRSNGALGAPARPRPTAPHASMLRRGPAGPRAPRHCPRTPRRPAARAHPTGRNVTGGATCTA